MGSVTVLCQAREEPKEERNISDTDPVFIYILIVCLFIMDFSHYFKKLH